MTEAVLIEPVRIAFEVECSVQHAFDTLTKRASVWWPAELTGNGQPGVTVNIEPHIGGRIFERSASGHEIDWGEITAWDPPKRLAYLWHIMTTRERATDVDIQFSPLETRRTRVEITHTGWERLGATGADWRNQNFAGWNGILPYYIEACRQTSS